MKRYCLVRMESGANKVIFDTEAPDLFEAVKKFQASVANLTLDKYGYATQGMVSYCVAEYWEPFHTVP